MSLVLTPIAFRFWAFFFLDTPTTVIYTLSLHDALPICSPSRSSSPSGSLTRPTSSSWRSPRSEEHTSELQSRVDLVCRLLLEKKKKDKSINGGEEHHNRKKDRTMMKWPSLLRATSSWRT